MRHGTPLGRHTVHPELEEVNGADFCYRAVVTTKDGSITAFFNVKK
jgi:hypothetical protein